MGAPTPTLITLAFASGAGGGFITSPLPTPSQIGSNPGRSSYTDGFVPLNATPSGSGGIAPWIQDMNGFGKDVSSNIVAFTGGQFWPFSAAWAAAQTVTGYAKGAMVAMAAGNGFWVNQTAGNSNNPDTTAAATSGWLPGVCVGASAITGLASGTVTLTAVQAAPSLLILTGTLTANVTLVLPPWGRLWNIVNQCTGAFSVIISSTGTGTATIPTGGIAAVVVDGSGNVTGGLVAASVTT